MKILQVHNRYRDPGGEDLVVQREADALRTSGHEVVQYDSTNLVSVPATIASLALAPWNAVEASRFSDAVRKLEPDVVHFHNTWFRLGTAVIRAASNEGVPTVMTLHNYRPICANAQLLRDGRPCEDCLTIGTGEAIRHRCYKGSVTTTAIAVASQAVARRKHVWEGDIDRYITLTTFARDTYVRGGFPAERIVVEPNRVHDPGPRPAPPSTSKTVLFVGRLDTLKGIDTLCDQWGQASSGLALEVVGSGPMESSLQNRHPTITFHGQLPPSEVNELMRRARAIVVPSLWYEGLPNVIIEALANGLPPIASSTMAVTPDLGALGSDWALDVNSSTDWARAIALLDSDGAVDSASRTARSLFLANYQSDAARSLLRVYESAIESRRGRYQAQP